jgi:mono/diheme cytochrome c family protein
LTRAIMLTAALTLAAAGTMTSAPDARGPGDTQEPLGQRVFEGKGACFTCHGREGRGTPLGPDLTDGDWIAFDQPPDSAAIEALVRSGVARSVRYPAPMPPMGGARLSRAELGAVAAYVVSLNSIGPPLTLYQGIDVTVCSSGPVRVSAVGARSP